MKREKKVYAIYEGDNFITLGPLEEIAKFLGITYGTLLTYKTKKIKYDFVLLGREYDYEKNIFIRKV